MRLYCEASGTPRQIELRLPSPIGNAQRPANECSAVGRSQPFQNVLRCSSAKGLETMKMRKFPAFRRKGASERGGCAIVARFKFGAEQR